MRPRRETSGHAWVRGRRMFVRHWPAKDADDGTALPDVVLGHGLAIGSRMCQPIGERLPAHYRVWAPDLPGFGASDKDGVLDVDGRCDWLAAWQRAADSPVGCWLGRRSERRSRPRWRSVTRTCASGRASHAGARQPARVRPGR